MTKRLSFEGAVDADGHVLEPPDLWDTYIEPRFRDRALRLVTDEHGLEELQIGGERSRMSRRGFPSTLGAMGDPDLRSMQLDPERTYRNKGYGSEAQRLLAEYLLQTFPIARVEAETDITNLAEQRALEKAGFVREGVLRKAQWRAGDWHDMVVYSRVRGD